MSRSGEGASVRVEEHPLLGLAHRDIITTIVMVVATLTLFILLKIPSTRADIQRIDNRVLTWMVAIRSPALTAVAKFFNVLGLIFVTLPVRLGVAGFLAFKRRWWHFAAFVSAQVVAEISIGTLKGFYDRLRPPGSLVSTSGGSFPSGHAVAASVIVVSMVIALFPEGPRRYWWGAAAMLFSFFMALSRVYLAAHWFSDAVAGVMLGTTVALGTAVIVHVIREHSPGGERERRAAIQAEATTEARSQAAGLG